MADPKRALAVNEAIKSLWLAANLNDRLLGPFWEEEDVPAPKADFQPYAIFEWIWYGRMGGSNQSTYYGGTFTLKVYDVSQEKAGYLLALVMDALAAKNFSPLDPVTTEGYLTSFISGREYYRRADRMKFLASVEYEVQRQRPSVKTAN